VCSEHKDRVATACCTHPTCAKFSFMCAECDEADHSSRSTRDHIRVPPSQSAVSVTASADALCSTHQQPLTGVCVTDGVPVCDKCLFDHSGHEFKRLDDVCYDWSTKLEALQRETLIRAHVLSDRAASVQHDFDEMVGSINTHFDNIDNGSAARRHQLLFEARRWRKMQLEEAKFLAAESSQLSATAMYERMLLQRVLQPDDLAPIVDAIPSSTVPEAVLGSMARQAQVTGSKIEAQSAKIDTSIAAMHTEDLEIIFDSTVHASILDQIKSMGKVSSGPDAIPEFDQTVAFENFIYPDAHTIQRAATNHNRWRTVRACQPLQLKKGVVRFAVKVEEYETKGSNTWKMIVGVVGPTFVCNAAHGIGKDSTFGYVAHNGNLSINAETQPFGRAFAKGDTISITIDKNRSRATFYKNGRRQGVHKFSHDISIDEFFAAVSMSEAGSRVKFVPHFEMQQ
jgi:SPRY domain/B-box zinc finger